MISHPSQGRSTKITHLDMHYMTSLYFYMGFVTSTRIQTVALIQQALSSTVLSAKPYFLIASEGLDISLYDVVLVPRECIQAT